MPLDTSESFGSPRTRRSTARPGDDCIRAVAASNVRQRSISQVIRFGDARFVNSSLSPSVALDLEETASEKCRASAMAATDCLCEDPKADRFPRVTLRAFVQQQPRRVDVAVPAGNVQRRPAALVRPINVRSFFQQQPRRVDVAVQASNE